MSHEFIYGIHLSTGRNIHKIRQIWFQIPASAFTDHVTLQNPPVGSDDGLSNLRNEDLRHQEVS
jgi:hypothetical protein